MENQIQQLYARYLMHPSISTDTRNIKKDSIFFALKGETFNGNKFAEQAITEGCALAVIDEEIYKKDERYILVADVLKTLQKLAKHHRAQLKVPIIAITGSNGKTTTKELVRAVLAKKYNVYATIGNLNNHIGVPLTLLSLNKEHQMAIVEMGANHIGEIAQLCDIAQPDFGIITNIGKAHLEGFGGPEGVIMAKKELYTFIQQHKGLLFINKDNGLLSDLSKGTNQISYGTSDFCNCTGKIIETQPFIQLQWKSSDDLKNIDESPIVTTHLPGKYNFENILAAVCIASYFQVEADKINNALENYIPGNNRSQLIKKENNTILLDAYNANPSSMFAAIENFSELVAENKILILGDMLELGNQSNFEHQALMALLKNKGFSKIFLVGKYFSELENDINAMVFKNAEEIKQWISLNIIKNSTILIKGSRGIKLESLVEVL